MNDDDYSVADASAVIGDEVATIYDWLRKVPISLIGSKPKGRWIFTATDMYALAIAADLISAGYAPHRAFNTAAHLGGVTGRDMRGGKPFRDEFALVPLADDFDAEPIRGHWSSLKGAKRAGIFVPLWQLYSDTQAACAAIYSKEAA